MLKTQALEKLNAATTKQELYELAGVLNNRPEHINQDKVTCLGFLDFQEGKLHILKMIQQSFKD